jgi:uncharacterized membrane protein YgcG
MESAAQPGGTVYVESLLGDQMGECREAQRMWTRRTEADAGVPLDKSRIPVRRVSAEPTAADFRDAVVVALRALQSAVGRLYVDAHDRAAVSPHGVPMGAVESVRECMEAVVAAAHAALVALQRSDSSDGKADPAATAEVRRLRTAHAALTAAITALPPRGGTAAGAGAGGGGGGKGKGGGKAGEGAGGGGGGGGGDGGGLRDLAAALDAAIKALR